MYKVALNFADGKTLFCPVLPNEILLDAALKSGIKIPLDCREGVCATCQGRCESGSYTQDYVDEEALSEQDLAERRILSCQTRVQSDASFYFDFDSSLCNSEGTTEIITTVKEVVHVSAGTAILRTTVEGDTDLYMEHAHYHVRQFRNGVRVWETFDNLTDARKFYRSVK